MATLAANTPRVWEVGIDHDMPVIASDIIFEGAAVGDNASGHARPLVAGDPFRGFALEKADNASGSAAAIDVKLRKEGYAELAIASLAITDVGKDVYASDDDTFTLTEGSNTRIGYVARWVSTGKGVVRFGAEGGRQTELTDSTGGTADVTLQPMIAGGTGAAAGGWDTAGNRDTSISRINDNFADIAKALNTIIRRLGG